jgi:glucosylglycerate synthase
MCENLSSALPIEAKAYLKEIETADIVVGVSSLNNVLTVNFVLSQAIKGLDTYFPDFKPAIVVSNENSVDNTMTEVKKISLPSEAKLIPAINMGLSGRGTAIKAIFEAALCLNAKSVVLIDSDQRSVTPEWIKNLLSPILTGTDFVAPYYNRRKYDGTITNFLCYPVTRSLFGKEIRQPIGGDFGLSIDLVKDILDSNMWEIPDVRGFGMTFLKPTQH